MEKYFLRKEGRKEGVFAPTQQGCLKKIEVHWRAIVATQSGIDGSASSCTKIASFAVEDKRIPNSTPKQLKKP